MCNKELMYNCKPITTVRSNGEDSAICNDCVIDINICTEWREKYEVSCESGKRDNEYEMVFVYDYSKFVYSYDKVCNFIDDFHRDFCYGTGTNALKEDWKLKNL